MPDFERVIRQADLHSCRSDYERQRRREYYEALDKGRLQATLLCCAVFIPTIMALTYALVNY